jgi:hypothetical protein
MPTCRILISCSRKNTAVRPKLSVPLQISNLPLLLPPPRPPKTRSEHLHFLQNRSQFLHFARNRGAGVSALGAAQPMLYPWVILKTEETWARNQIMPFIFIRVGGFIPIAAKLPSPMSSLVRPARACSPAENKQRIQDKTETNRDGNQQAASYCAIVQCEQEL